MVVEEAEMELKTMEAQETAALGPPPKDLSHNVKRKRKRTKRQRPQSPISFTIPMQYSSSYGGDNFVNSTTTEEEEIFPDSVAATEEEEATAKCLLLLSQGHYSVKQNYDIHFGSTNKFSSKRYLETHTTPNGNKAGIYVYECKTCSRTFPSFQALGGHRASHKKPKGNAVILSDDEDHPIKPSFKRNSSTSSLSLQFSNRPGPFINNNFKSSPKVHECAICGAEFTSGQALGGHMRRHRGVLPSATTNTTLSLSSLPSPRAIEIDQEESMKSNGINLSLDLNLPAAHEDDREPAPLSLTLKQQQQKQKQSPLSFSSAPTLEDCHN